VGVVLALGAAAAYGFSDFIGGITSRRTSAWAVAVVATAMGGLFALLAAFVIGGTPTRTDLMWGAVAGIGNGVGTGFLYRGLSAGRMGVVAPLSGVGAALVPVAAGLAGGERPAMLVWLGIAAALPGIWLVASEPPPGAEGELREGFAAGVMDGVLAGLGFGSLFAALGQVPQEAGFYPLVVNQFVGVVVVAALAAAMRADWVPRHPRAWWGTAAGFLGVAATVAFMLAVQSGSLTVSGILTALYPAFTILLAMAVLREHVHRGQAIGLVFCGLAIGLVAAG
jgi:drug/metabolite transporter (DMT)-like permease